MCVVYTYTVVALDSKQAHSALEVLRGPDFYVVSGGGVGDFNIIKGKVRSHLSRSPYTFCKTSATLTLILLSCCVQSMQICTQRWVN